jgi:hypothetical protein
VSYGAVVHATLGEREQLAEKRTAANRELMDARYAWAASHLPDLPADWVVVALGMLRFGLVAGITTDMVRERTERNLQRADGWT